MIIKKTLVTTSTFVFSAVLLSQAYTFTANRIQAKEINYSAFINLTQNMKSLSHVSPLVKSNREDTQITKDIIKVIEKEISRKNSAAKYSVLSLKKKIQEKSESENHSIAMVYEDLSSFEINNKDFIPLYAFKAERIEFSKFENIALSPSYNDEIKDEVVVAQASTDVAPIEADEVKVIQPATYRTELAEEKSENSQNEEMVMFEYSEKNVAEEVLTKEMDKKLYERPLSDTVKQVISREIGIAPVKKIAEMTTHKEIESDGLKKNDEPQIDLDSEDNIVYDYSTKDNIKKVDNQKDNMNAFMVDEEVNTHEAQYSLLAKEINLNTHKNTQIHGFEFIPDYERAERVSDQNSGAINFNYSLNGEMNTQTGVLKAQGMIPTRVELDLGKVKAMEVPMFNEEGIQKLLQKKNISIEGNLLMIALSAAIVDVEIDSQFDQKFFYDKNFKSLSSMMGASFVLFAGVNDGNILIRYLLKNKEMVQKIVYVGSGEMYFEDPVFSDGTRDTFMFTTRTLLGQRKKELIIDGSAISFFNTSYRAKKKALNAYELKIPTLSSGMRKYLEFKHLKDTIFVGTWNKKEIEIPSNDFIAKVLEVNHVNSLKERCVVQVNITKDLRELKVNGKNRSGEMFVETSFLDSDGNFSNESSERAEKAFIVGDMEGLLGVRLDYTDDSSEFVKTFCSEGSYLVEQL